MGFVLILIFFGSIAWLIVMNKKEKKFAIETARKEKLLEFEITYGQIDEGHEHKDEAAFEVNFREQEFIENNLSYEMKDYQDDCAFEYRLRRTKTAQWEILLKEVSFYFGASRKPLAPSDFLTFLIAETVRYRAKIGSEPMVLYSVPMGVGFFDCSPKAQLDLLTYFTAWRPLQPNLNSIIESAYLSAKREHAELDLGA